MQLKGKIALITGAGSGIGRALALGCAARGATIVLAGRRAGSIGIVQAEIEAAGGPAISVSCDVTSTVGRKLLCHTLAQRFGHLDLLVNNAGMALAGPIGTITDSDLERLLATNIHAPIAMVRDCLSLLRASGSSPRVVNIGSVMGDIGHPLFAGYCASKFGLRGFSDALRRELLPEGIGVTYVAPRATRTEGATAFAHLIEPFGMSVDDPSTAATSIIRAIERDSKSRYATGAERFFVWVQKLAPGLIDMNLAQRMTKYIDQDVPDSSRQTGLSAP